jgi:single-strand DNA-binding protein
MYLNRITLIGFIGKDAEPRVTRNQVGFTVLSIATKSSWKDRETGEWQSRTEWHRATVWGARSEYAKTLLKGAHVHIEGELRSREYQRQVGPKDHATTVNHRFFEVRVSSIRKLDRPVPKEGGAAPAQVESEVPF